VPESYDLLWNNESRLIRFHRAAKLPSNGSNIKIVGRRFLPVIAKVRDTEAINTTQSVEGGSGEHEYLIVDDSIVTKEAARQRAQAELLAYAKSIVEGKFVSRTDGFKAGQEVRVNSTNLDINSKFIISKVTTKMFTPTTPIYSITLVTTRTFGIIDFFQRMINKQKIEIDRCPRGHGLWFDQGELKDLVASFHEGEAGKIADFFAEMYASELKKEGEGE